MFSTPLRTENNIKTLGKRIRVDRASIVQTIQNVNRDMVNLCEWLITNKLSLNIGKTEHMFIASDDTLNKISDSTVIFVS